MPHFPEAAGRLWSVCRGGCDPPKGGIAHPVRIGLVINEEKLREEPEALSLVKEAIRVMEEAASVLLNAGSAKLLERPEIGVPPEEVTKRADLLIVLGGDGTILRASRQAGPRGIPVLGVNVGGFGFLAEVGIRELKEVVPRLLKGDFALDERMMLEAVVERGEERIEGFLALNDMVVTKSGYARLLRLRTYINGEHLATYPADGLIVSTPTGSTAYSLSAGGPIVHPRVEVILVTPICPHMLHARSVVVSGNDTVTVEFGGGVEEAMLTVDGQEGFLLQGGDRVLIRRATPRAKLIRLHPFRFYTLLRQKLSWGER